MTDKEAIKYLELHSAFNGKLDKGNCIRITEENFTKTKLAIETVLNLIQTQQEEIEQSNKVIDKRNEEKIELVEICLKKDKIIDEMAKYIEDESTVDEFCSKENCYADDYENGHCRKCLNCIKKYFINKAEEEN